MRFRVIATRREGRLLTSAERDSLAVTGIVSAEERTDHYLRRATMIASVRTPTSLLELRPLLFDVRLTRFSGEVISMCGFERISTDNNETFVEYNQSWILQPIVEQYA
jgi:hypothetical protein